MIKGSDQIAVKIGSKDVAPAIGPAWVRDRVLAQSLFMQHHPNCQLDVAAAA